MYLSCLCLEGGDCGAGCGPDCSCLCLSCLAFRLAYLPEKVGQVFFGEVLQANSLQSYGVNMEVVACKGGGGREEIQLV